MAAFTKDSFRVRGTNVDWRAVEATIAEELAALTDSRNGCSESVGLLGDGRSTGSTVNINSPRPESAARPVRRFLDRIALQRAETVLPGVPLQLTKDQMSFFVGHSNPSTTWRDDVSCALSRDDCWFKVC